MRPFRRKPKFTHPCRFCEARGYVAPHRGQHQVTYILPMDADRIPPGAPALTIRAAAQVPPVPPPPGRRS